MRICDMSASFTWTDTVYLIHENSFHYVLVDPSKWPEDGLSFQGAVVSSADMLSTQALLPLCSK